MAARLFLYLSNKTTLISAPLWFLVSLIDVVDTQICFKNFPPHQPRNSHALSERDYSDDKGSWSSTPASEVLQIHFSRRRSLVLSTPCVLATNPQWTAPQMSQQSIQLIPLCWGFIMRPIYPKSSRTSNSSIFALRIIIVPVGKDLNLILSAMATVNLWFWGSCACLRGRWMWNRKCRNEGGADEPGGECPNNFLPQVLSFTLIFSSFFPDLSLFCHLYQVRASG